MAISLRKWEIQIMKKEITFLASIIFFVLLVSGCGNGQSESYPPIPDINVSTDHVNQDIDLILRPSRNTFKIDDDIVIDVHLLTDIQMD
ncbi:MAG: hypothetical protein U0Z26_18485 [Anaerolineales bacterium]